jgi:uncharacterized protein
MPDTLVEKTTDRPVSASCWRDDAAYVAPMAAFLALTWAGGKWPSFFAVSYVLKTILAAGLLIALRRYYTRIRWSYWWLGILVGLVGIVQWVGMEELLLRYWPSYPKIPASTEPFDPYKAFASPWTMWGFIAIRWAGAALVVPFMEELFWRDFLWRSTASPYDFKLSEVGERDWKAFAIVLVFFTSVHPQWIVAVVWGAMNGWLLIRTRSIGACIIAHAVTNFLLGAYVQWTGKWYYW